MNPIEELKEEHQGVLLMLGILEAFCARLEAGSDADLEHADRILEFLKVFLDTCHHAKEEDFLFPAMERAGIFGEGGPIGVLLQDHAVGRERVREMTEAVEALRRGDMPGAEGFTRIAGDYIDLLRAHIDMEDTILYPSADERLSADTLEELSARFQAVEEERIGHGRHEAFHAMMERLKGIYLG